MDLDISIDGGKNGKLTIPLINPHNNDLKDVMAQIDVLAVPHGIDTKALDITGLIRKMIKGVSGCERGCPGDALSFVQKGHPNFTAEYVEGGIVIAKHRIPGKVELSLKLFPDFT